MKYKICFLSGAHRTVEADCFTMDEHLIVFGKDGSPILTCVASKVCYWHPEESLALPLAAQVGLFEGRV